MQTVNGDNKNVLSRFLLASQKIPDSSYIFRITGDNPFIDINAINLLYKHLLIKKADYSYTQNMPLGMGCEAFKKKALMNLNNEILLPHHKEHVTIYFRENSEKFRIAPLKMYKTNYAEIIRMTVDQNEDLKMAEKTYEYFQKQNLPRFGASEVIELFNTNREFFNWNNHISQNSALVYEK
ncbi:MAG: hypothetical protein OEZ13_11620 [Spirochaetia bacterium]|nr:hypothetical protein [Spirochaetia bacterium]